MHLNYIFILYSKAWYNTDFYKEIDQNDFFNLHNVYVIVGVQNVRDFKLGRTQKVIYNKLCCISDKDCVKKIMLINRTV